MSADKKARGANPGEKQLNDTAEHHEKAEIASDPSPFIRCSKCLGLTHRGVVESTPTRVLCCACCGSLSVNPADLRAEFAERRRLIVGDS